jgi:hypothetical protein
VLQAQSVTLSVLAAGGQNCLPDQVEPMKTWDQVAERATGLADRIMCLARLLAPWQGGMRTDQAGSPNGKTNKAQVQARD